MSFPIVLRRGKFFVSSILQHKISAFRFIFQIGLSKIFIREVEWGIGKEKATSSWWSRFFFTYTPLHFPDKNFWQSDLENKTKCTNFVL